MTICLVLGALDDLPCPRRTTICVKIVRAEVEAQLGHAAEDLGGARAGVREDEALHAGRMVERVLEREHAAPRLAVEMDAAEPSARPHRLELLDEARDSPERRVVRDVRLAASELVVEEHLEPVASELAKPLEVPRWCEPRARRGARRGSPALRRRAGSRSRGRPRRSPACRLSARPSSLLSYGRVWRRLGRSAVPVDEPAARRVRRGRPRSASAPRRNARARSGNARETGSRPRRPRGPRFRRVERHARPRHRLEQAPRVRVERRREDRLDGPVSTARPRYMTSTSSATCRTTARSWEMRMYVSRSSRRRSARRLRICAWIETSSAETASSSTRIFGSAASARAMATRWRWPPDSSRGSARASFSPSPTASSSSLVRAACSACGAAEVHPLHLVERPPDRLARVERRVGILEDDLDGAAALAPLGPGRLARTSSGPAARSVRRSAAPGRRASGRSSSCPSPDSPTMPSALPARARTRPRAPPAPRPARGQRGPLRAHEGLRQRLDGRAAEQAGAAFRHVRAACRLASSDRISSIRRQAEDAPGSTRRSGGTSARQASTANAQRGWNGTARRASRPGWADVRGSPSAARFASLERRAGREKARPCTGGSARRRGSRSGCSSMMRPAYMTMTRSQIAEASSRSCVMNSIASSRSRRSASKIATISAWIVTSSAVVGSSAISRSGSPASAPAIITRWSIPPDSSPG